MERLLVQQSLHTRGQDHPLTTHLARSTCPANLPLAMPRSATAVRLLSTPRCLSLLPEAARAARQRPSCWRLAVGATGRLLFQAPSFSTCMGIMEGEEGEEIRFSIVRELIRSSVVREMILNSNSHPPNTH